MSGVQNRFMWIKQVMLWLFVVFMLCALVLPQSALALVPSNIEEAVEEGSTAGIESSLVHSHAQNSHGEILEPSREPSWGDYFTYTFTWRMSNLNEKGTTQQPIKLSVIFPSTAKLGSEVMPKDFNLPHGWELKDLVGDSSSGYTVNIVPDSSASDGVVTLTKQARIPAKNEQNTPTSGDIIWASSMAETSVKPNIELKKGQYFFKPDAGNSCAGTFQFQWKLNAGAWLAHIKFADASGRGKVVLSEKAPVEGGGSDAIRVTDASGKDITGRILAKMASWNPADSSPPYQTNPYATQYPNLKWLQSANWKIDISTHTGDTWIPANSTVTVHKYGRHLNCVAGIATDWQADRPVEALMEVVRPITSVSSNATDPLKLGGGKLSASCLVC